MNKQKKKRSMFWGKNLEAPNKNDIVFSNMSYLILDSY